MMKLAAGEVALLGELYRRYGNSVYRMLRFTLRSEATNEDIEDLGQEVFIRTYRNAGKYSEMGKCEAWILKIAATEAKSFRKKRRNRKRLFGIFKHERIAHEEQRAETQLKDSDLSSVSDAISRLPESQRDILVLSVGQCMKVKEIAETLGLSANAVSVKLHRARTSMQKQLGFEKGDTASGESR